MADKNKPISKTRIYNIWCCMKKRCTYKKGINFHIYGGRGISYCEKWEKFEGFYEDMKEGYSDILSLDRIDNNGNYCKENCRWTNRITQCNNRSSNTFIEYNGMKKTIEEWSRFLNIKSSTLRQRYFCYKWSIEKCLTFKLIKNG